MSAISKLVDESVQVVEVEAGGLRLCARVRRATAGELLEAGAGGMVVPEAAPGAPRRPVARNRDGVAAMVDGWKFQQGLLRACVMAVGAPGEPLEPCTIVATEAEKERPGTRPLPVYALPPELAAALATKVIELTQGEDWRRRVASFLGVRPADAGSNGAEVGHAPHPPA